MAEDKSQMSGWRVGLNTVGAMLGFLVVGAGGCQGGDCSCSPSPSGVIAVIPSGCGPPVVKTTGPCTAALVPLAFPQENSQGLALTPNGAGTCHVEVTFGSGATSSVDLDFVSEWRACGSDPHGCGQAFVATNQVSVPAPTCDAGLDAEFSD
jgi:hypothetical protein